MQPEDLLEAILGFRLDGWWLIPVGGGERRMATDAEYAMWQALLYQARKATDCGL